MEAAAKGEDRNDVSSMRREGGGVHEGKCGGDGEREGKSRGKGREEREEADQDQ